MTSRSEIAARLAAATPGPWFEYSEPEVGYMPTVHCPNDNERGGHHPVWDDPANLSLIAHAPTDLAFLLREIAEREARLATARERIAYLEEQEGRRGQSTHSELCWQWHPECARLRVEAAEAKVAGLSRLLGDADEIITWMSGSMDFGPNGQAHQGWLKMQERIIEIRAALAGTSDTGVAG